MGKIQFTRVQPNEVVKATDFTFGFDSQVNNITTVLQAVLEAEKDFVINGEVTPYSSGMNVSIAPIFGIAHDTGDMFVNTEKTEPIGIGDGWSVDRWDIIEIKSIVENKATEQRAFIDFDSKQKTLQDVPTKKELSIDINVKHNENDGQFHATPPETTEGYVKLCEIFVPANAISIDECIINNITSIARDEENENWNIEKSRTYNIGYISTINKRYMVNHNSDGSHKNKSIKMSNIDTGIGVNQVNSNYIPLGGSDISINHETSASSSTVRSIIEKIAAKITDLFDAYLKNGAFNFNNEVSISSLIDENNILVNALKLSADGEGNAYFKINNEVIFTITNTGTIRTKNNYKAENALDLITKSVTDALNTRCTTLESTVALIMDGINTSSEINKVLSKFKIGQTCRCATTGNITLSGLQTIDGVSVNADDIVIVKNQTDLKENGIYIANSGFWSRGEFNTVESIAQILFPVIEGSRNGGHIFISEKDVFVIDGDESPANNIIFSDTYFSIKPRMNTVAMHDENGNVKTNTPKEQQDSINLATLTSFMDDLVPIGMVLPYYGPKNVSLKYFVLMDGVTRLGSDYPKLYSHLLRFKPEICDTELGTFTLPDTSGRFLEGSDGNVINSGELIDAGLPNITGSFLSRQSHNPHDLLISRAGVFSKGTNGSSTTTWDFNGSSYDQPSTRTLFNANKGETDINGNLKTDESTKVFGKSNTVQPSALTTCFMIRC